jgi:hypothetical protein
MRGFHIAAWAVVGFLSFLAFGQGEDGILREGEGPRRQDLNGRELKPFPFEHFSRLSDWRNGSVLSESEAAGKPVLIVTWTDYIPVSRRAFLLAKRMSDTYGPEGLIVVAAHGPQEWASAKIPEPGKGAMLLAAHDSQGDFRKAIASDGDPDFYVIDRAGQLRFADIMTESVEAACALVVKESREEAAAQPVRRKEAAERAAAELRRTEAMRQGVDLTRLPEVEFEVPGPEKYKKAAWPKPPEDEQAKAALQPGQKYDALENLERFAAAETAWYPNKPNTKGRLVVLYFWHPEARFTIDQIDRFELRQRQRGRDVVFVGVISPLGDNSGQSKFNMDPEFIKESMTKFHSKKNLRHYFLVDPDGSMWTTSTKTYQMSSGYPIPWGMIVGSDEMIHWWGHLDSPPGQAALDRMLAVDPGVLARRAAEDEYIKSRQNGAK